MIDAIDTTARELVPVDVRDHAAATLYEAALATLSQRPPACHELAVRCGELFAIDVTGIEMPGRQAICNDPQARRPAGESVTISIGRGAPEERISVGDDALNVVAVEESANVALCPRSTPPVPGLSALDLFSVRVRRRTGAAECCRDVARDRGHRHAR